MAKHKHKEQIEEEVLEEQVEEELEEVKNEDGYINEEQVEEELSPEEESFKDKYIKLQADFENFKARTDREKSDMIFFLKQDILLKVLPRLDDLERMLKNTPEEDRK
jgi:molecular chaperone GrpE